jgi:hypothetical protein
MKTLVIHHLEPMWQEGYRNQGTDFETLCERIGEHISENDYDRIILTRFESFRLDEPEYDFLTEQNPYIECKEYGYGWVLESFIDEDEENIDDIRERIESGEIYELRFGSKLADGGNHSEVVMIEDWMESIKSDEVFICGAFDGECVEDLEIALGTLKIEFTRLEDYIV